MNRGESRVTCKKADIHPQFFSDAKVYCNGELVMTTGGTQKEYIVDVWPGNHPFFWTLTEWRNLGNVMEVSPLFRKFPVV